MDSKAQGGKNSESNNNNDLLNLKYYGFRGRQRPMEPLDFVSDTKIVLWKTTIVWMQVTREIGPLSIRVLIEDDSNRVGIVPFASRTLRTRALNNNEVQSLAKEAENVQEYSDFLQDSKERMAIVLKVKYVVGEARKKGTIIIQIVEQNAKVVEEKEIKFVVQSRHYAQRSHLLSPQYRRESKLKAQSEKIRSSRRKSALSSSVSSDPSPSPSPPSSPSSEASPPSPSSSSPPPSLVLAASSFDDTSSSLLAKHEEEEEDEEEEEYTETRSSRGRKIKKKQMGPKKPPKVTKQLETETRAMKRKKAQEVKEVKKEEHQEKVVVSVASKDEDDRLDKVNKQDDDFSFDSEDEDSSVASMLDFSSKIVNFPTHKILHSMVQNPQQPPPFSSFPLPPQQHLYHPHPHHQHHHQYPPHPHYPHHTSLYAESVPQPLPSFSYSHSPSHSGLNTRNTTSTTTTTSSSSSTNTVLLSSSHSFVSLDNEPKYNSKNNLDMLLGPPVPSPSPSPLPPSSSSSSFHRPLPTFAPHLNPFPAPLSSFDVKK